ncbi:MAG: hypothetical protein AAFV93_00485 [Chloroflexota bacterium]
MEDTINANPNKNLLCRILHISVLGLLVIVVMLGGAYIYSTLLLNPVSSTLRVDTVNTFDGQTLLTVSDADMVGTAYADGVLMQVPNDRDTLTLIDLPITDEVSNLREIFVSNSVTSWPQIMEISPDGNRAYVIETAGEIEDTVEVYENVLSNPPTGRLLTVIDLNTDETRTYDIVDNPVHLALHPDERFIAIGGEELDKQLVILPVETLDDETTYQYFSIVDNNGIPAQEITSVSWHPDGTHLAVGINRSELVFFEIITSDNTQIEIEQVGDYLLLGNTISYGEFTSDGQHYLTTEINWEAVTGQLGFIFNPRGEMLSIRFDPSGNHQVVSRVEVGQSPEGFAISSDDSLIVTVDMRRTYLPDSLSFVPGTILNSLTLLTFDNSTGQLEWIEDYGFEGVLPEHATFDADNDALAVVIYNERESPMNPAYIEFWNVEEEGNIPRLERTNLTIPVVRGAHFVYVIP